MRDTGFKLRALMALLGINQKQLAEAAGLSNPHLSRILTGHAAPHKMHPATRRKLVDAMRSLIIFENII